MDIAFAQREKLHGLILKAISDAVEAGDLSSYEVPEFVLEVPKDPNHGDFASNVALVSAKAARRAPRDVAEALVKHIPVGTFIAKVEVAGPGFINFFLSQEWLGDILRAVEMQGENYGASNYGQGEKVLLEFVSANPVGPLNVVNARAAAVGDTLARLMRASGYQVGTEFYVNDAGNQADVFARSLIARCHQEADPDYPFPEDGYPGDYVTDLAKQLLAERPDFLELPEDEQAAFCKRWGTDQMVKWQAEDLRDYGVEFDLWFRERDLHAQGKLEEVIAFFREKGYLYEEEGALWFRSTAFGDDKDRVLIKSDGLYTYVTADIAYHHDKLKRGYTKLIDILGPDHHGYIGRMKAAVQALGYGEDTLEVLILQYVALLRDGKPVKMSKRAGEFITMRELVDEVGTDAARFFFLNRSLESHLDFDMSLAVEQSSENPVFYVQYAHARICSILRQAEEVGVAVPTTADVDLSLLSEEAEVNLIKKLGELPEEILLATTLREPHRIARYALDLASTFHSFYTHCHVLGEEAPVRDARLVLVNCVLIVLRRTLSLLGISAPEQM
ncbi:MAG TPA: arginine--tRNA ligase [Firmicutes bacterium]|jgi:arginyl-tRNA synthetase|nr:arginine--tRNA ligase [Bacillota bacterium]